MMFSEQLYALRKENRLTQEFLAEKCNVSRQAVAKWESGESLPNIHKIIQIAKIFDVSLDELVLGDGKKNNEQEIAQIIYNLYVENMENLRTCMMSDDERSDEKLATEVRTEIKKARIAFSKHIVDELLSLTEDFGESVTYVLEKHGEITGEHMKRNRKYCEQIIPEKYDRIEKILGKYLGLS